MNVTLVSPYPDVHAFGPRTLSACLKRAGHSVQLVFLPHPFAERYSEQTLTELAALAKGTDLLGISLMTNFFENAVQLTQALQGRIGVPVLWGGIHPTVRPAECMEHADMVCVGEGEETVVELAARMERGQSIRNIQGLWLRDKQDIVCNPPRLLISDLDSIPFPDYEVETHFILSEGHLRPMDMPLLAHYTRGIYMTLATRGCPFGCAYCCNNTLNSMFPGHKTVRKRSVDNVIKELAQVKARLPFVQRIQLDDDAFFLYTDGEIQEFAQRYKESVGLPLAVTGATPSTLSESKLSSLVDAGLIFIRLGIQTASERTKRLYGRHMPNKEVEEAVRVIHQFQDRIPLPAYEVIVDNPWETDQDLVDTLMFMANLPPPYYLFVYSLTFFPETDLYRRAKEEGIITDDLRDVYRKAMYLPRRTYLNRLFLLLHVYARRGYSIPPRWMAILTQRALRRSRLAWLPYAMLRAVGAGFELRARLDPGRRGPQGS